MYENNTRSSSCLEVCDRRWGNVVEDVCCCSCGYNLVEDQEEAAASRLKVAPLIATKGCRCVIFGERDTVAESSSGWVF